MIIKHIRILTPIFLVTLVAMALIFIPFEASSDSIPLDLPIVDMPEGTFP